MPLLAPVALAIEPRQARAAGGFYPDDRQALQELVTTLLAAPAPITAPGKTRILIVPHAGYAYSGSVAAAAYRLVQDQAYDGVVVVGFTHRAQFPGASLDWKDSYETPLGELPIHQEAVQVLQSQPGLTYLEEAHESGEHSMEVQLPFIQVALPQTRVVPILMGSVDWADAEQLASALAVLSRLGNYLFVFSTDLSHYHDYPKALRQDKRTIEAIVQETPQAVQRLFADGALEACGRGPIITALLLAEKLGYPSRRLIAAANSGDTAGRPERVVGYAAIGFFEVPAPAVERLSPQAGQALVQAARQTLEAALQKPKADFQTGLNQIPELQAAKGVFVTLRKGGELRGCIGRVRSEEPLSAILPQVALDAALQDPRFPPVTAEELPALTIEAAVLTAPREILSVGEIVPGRDGVILEYEGHAGVFLPIVWQETGWTREQFLRELAAQKAGLSPEAWQLAKLSVFQDQVFQEEAVAQATLPAN